MEETTEMFLETRSVVYAASGLLAGCNDNLVCIYRILLGGRLASVAMFNCRPEFYSVHLEHRRIVLSLCCEGYTFNPTKTVERLMKKMKL